jgi:RTX calcium-binding nonapeptide repeat (4 copies)
MARQASSSRLSKAAIAGVTLNGDSSNNKLTGTVNDDTLYGKGSNDTLLGGSGADKLFGGDGNDTLKGEAGDDRAEGGNGDDQLLGAGGKDTLLGGNGSDTLTGGDGNDTLKGNAGKDTLKAGNGNDSLTGGNGKDTLTSGAGNDTFVFSTTVASSSLTSADVITDFADGQDVIKLSGLTFADLKITQGTGDQAGNTIIQIADTGDYLSIVQGISSNTLTAADFQSSSTVSSPAAVSISSSTIKFGSGDSQSAIASSGAAKITIGTQTIYIGTQQVTSTNQNPIIASFDSSNSSNNWVKTNYEMTGADGRGYGLFWSGTNLYAVFSVDGTQGSSSEDFRRVSGDATQSWLRSYGQGGGAKVSVLAKLNPATGEMTDAVYLSAILSSGDSNSLSITDLSVNSSGNVVVSAQSYFSPRNPDGSAMTQVTTASSPFDYTVVITPDLTTVVDTSAVGWT